MVIYKYTMLKFLKSTSTWVILFIAFAITFGITGPLSFSKVGSNPEATDYHLFTNAFFVGFLLLVILFGSIFIGFKGGQVYKDEVEDGTFLIILSKPQSRSKIILFKWLALSTISVLFLFTLLLSLSLGVAIFGRVAVISNGINISIWHNLPKDLGILFVISFVVIMILSSIALIISTKVSTGATIGMTIAIGVFVQITGLIGQFSSKESYDTSFIQNSPKTEEKKLLYDMNRLNKGAKVDYKPVAQIISMLYSSSITKGTIKIGTTSIKGAGLGFIGIDTNEFSSFSYLSFFDLNYQVSLLSSIAGDVATNNSTFETNSIQYRQMKGIGKTGNIKKQKFVKQYTQSEFDKEVKNKVQSIIDKTNTSIAMWALKEKLLNLLVTPIDPNKPPKLKPELLVNWTYIINLGNLKKIASHLNINPNFIANNNPYANNDSQLIQTYLDALSSKGKLNEIKYVDFINKYAILGIYMALAIILVPSSYYILRRQDFR